MKRVLGIGGIFFKARDPAALHDWYRAHLGIEIEPWGGTAFRWAGPHNPDGHGTTVWNIFEASSGYFAPSQAQFMVNYRVDKLEPLLAALREALVPLVRCRPHASATGPMTAPNAAIDNRRGRSVRVRRASRSTPWRDSAPTSAAPR